MNDESSGGADRGLPAGGGSGDVSETSGPPGETAAAGADASLLARARDALAGIPATRTAGGAGGEVAALPLPERIGDYLIRSILGVGGMGVVYEAEQQQPRRIVALAGR